MGKHYIGAVEQIAYPGGKDGMWRGHCGADDYTTAPVASRREAGALVDTHAHDKNLIDQAKQIVAKLAKANELVTEAESLLRDAEALMRADEVSTVSASENAREAAELVVVLRVGFHRRLREVLSSWQGYYHARNR